MSGTDTVKDGATMGRGTEASGASAGYDRAIFKLKEMSQWHEEFADMIDRGEVTNVEDDRKRSLTRTYRWWAQCCSMAAWLLYQEVENSGS